VNCYNYDHLQLRLRNCRSGFKAIARKSSCNRKTIKSDKLIGYCVEAKHCCILCPEVTRVKRHHLKAMIIDTSVRPIERLQLTPYSYEQPIGRQSRDLSLAS